MKADREELLLENTNLRAIIAEAHALLDAAKVQSPAYKLSGRVQQLIKDRDQWQRRARELESLCADRL